MLDNAVLYLCLFSPFRLYLLRQPDVWLHRTMLLCKAYLHRALQCCAQRIAQVYLSQGQSKITLLVRQAGHRASLWPCWVGSRPGEPAWWCCNMVWLQNALADPQIIITKMHGVAVGCSTSDYLENSTFFLTHLPLKRKCTRKKVYH